MCEMLVKPKEKYDITHKDMPVQKKSESKYEPLGYMQCVPEENRQDHYLPQKPKSMEMVSENGSGDDGIIQMWRIMDISYESKKPFIYRKGTEQNFKSRLNTAMSLAQEHLKNFTNAFSQSNDATIIALVEYAQKVYDALTLDEMEIYPLRGSSYGLAKQDIYAISINVNMVIDNSEWESAKTLVHEAFHIIGGCSVGKEGNCDSQDFNEMVKDMCGKELEKINADTFAQFIMIQN